MKGNKSKKTLILVLIAMVMVLTLKVEVFAAEKSGTAQTTTKNGGTIGWSFKANEATKQITNLKCTNPEGISGEIEIPSTIEVEGVEYTVVSLEYDAFKGASAITKVTIPNTVNLMKEYINNGCFENCTSLTSVELGNITNINSNCFKGCVALKTITIPNTVTTIGSGAFSSCTSLESCNIPNTVSTLTGTFYGCTKLKSISIPSSVTTISSEHGIWDSLSSDYINGCFENCTSLTEIIIPNSVNTIDDATFEGCTNLKNVTLSNKIQELPSYLFKNCKSLTEIKIPDSVVSIQSDSKGEGAFYNCEALQKVTIPDTVTFIGKYAFQDCGKGKLGLFVKQGSYAETWAKTNEVTYSYGDGTSQSGSEEDGKNQSSDNEEQEPTEQKPQEQTPSTEQQIPADDGKDETVTSATKIPQTGEKYGMFIVAGIVVLAGAIGIIRYKKYKGI